MNPPTAPRPLAGRAATRIFVGLCAIALVLAVAVGAARAADAIDARLAGTWKLQWQGSPIYWAVREGQGQIGWLGN